VLGARVPNLILQPLVENAIRHGIAPRAAPGRVAIRAYRRRDTLVLEVEDDGVGLDAAAGNKGIGLANTRARLEQLYGEAYRFTLEGADGGGTRATVEFPYDEA
jgi:sensor histidine kinase YesM